MKSNTVKTVILFFWGLAKTILYYAVSLVAFFAEVLLLCFLLDVFNASLYKGYVWLTLTVAVAVLLMPKLFYATFLKMWNGAKRIFTITIPGTHQPSEVEKTKYAYLFALMPALILDWGMIISFYDDLVHLVKLGGDIPKLLTAILGFMIAIAVFYVLLVFADKQFKQLFRKSKNN